MSDAELSKGQEFWLKMLAQAVELGQYDALQPKDKLFVVANSDLTLSKRRLSALLSTSPNALARAYIETAMSALDSAVSALALAQVQMDGAAAPKKEE